MLNLWPDERRAIAPPEPISAADWSNRNIVLLPESSREPGPYRWQRTPYHRDILNLYQHPQVRHIVLKWATQVGKTVILYNMLGYVIDQDPFSTMLSYPSDDEAKTISRTRVQPLIEAARTLREKKPFDQKRYQLTEMSFPGLVLYVIGANSPTPMSQKPCRNVFRDEVNKWPPQIKDHGDPMDLSTERMKGYWDIRKIVDVSSPTTESGNITKQEALCQAQLRYFVPCPDCGRLQTLEWEQIKFENDRELETIYRIQKAKNTAYYECKFCQTRIDDSWKEWMLDPENGAAWFDERIEEPQKTADPIGELFEYYNKEGIELESIAASELSSLYSPWIRWADVVEKFLEAHLSTFRRFDKLRSFTNDWLAKEWKDVIHKKSEDAILNLRCELAPHIVPAAAVALTAGIDCQKDGFYFVVRAWARDYTNWLIRYGFLLSENDVYRLIYEDTYEREDGGDRGFIWRAGMDTGGGSDGDMSMTAQAYRFISLRGGSRLFGTKGASRVQTQPIKLSMINTYPGKRQVPIPGAGVRLCVLDTILFKDVFHSQMQIKDGDPGCVYLHADTDMDYAGQIVSEEKMRDTKGIYRWEHVRGENHYLDAEVICFAMASPFFMGGLDVIGGTKKAAAEVAGTEARPTDIAAGDRSHKGKGVGWMPQRGGWLKR
jgi:phage terminase large subunit GpA-like protein